MVSIYPIFIRLSTIDQLIFMAENVSFLNPFIKCVTAKFVKLNRSWNLVDSQYLSLLVLSINSALFQSVDSLK